MNRMFALISLVALLSGFASAAENWNQYQADSRHSGNITDRHLDVQSLGLQGAVPLTDAIFTSPVIVDGRIYVIDGAGVVFCIDAHTLAILWKTKTDNGPFNCNNVSSPAVTGGYVHVGTTGGTYFVLDAGDGHVVQRIACGEPIFAAPVVTDKGVYFSTLGSCVYGLTPAGKIRWKWSYVREVLKFSGNPWDGGDWARHKKGHVSWRDQFCCSRNIVASGPSVVVPAGGVIIWLRDEGDHAVLAAGYTPRESPATYGLSMDDKGNVYRQWYRRDNTGRVEILKLENGKVVSSFVPGTETRYSSDSSLGFASVSLRDGDVYRTRPEQGAGLRKHLADGSTQRLSAYPSIAPPVLVGEHALVSGLDGTLYVVSLKGAETKKFKTAFGRPITAPPAVADGRIVFGCEDGYLYVMASGGTSKLPARPLDLTRIRSPLRGKFASSKYDWFTNFGNLANTNRASEQDLRAPFKVRWMRRVEGTIKQASVAGGGRMFTHTAEGQIFAVEQQTGRLLWRVYHPGVHISYTAPIYYDGKLLVPQAGLKKSRLRCLDAATGRLLWEVPFTGSPSWNRQLPPLVYDGLVFYQFSTGKYSGKEWLFEHQRTFGFPDGHKPLLRAWDLETGKEKWSLDFSKYGAGGDDAGICLLDGKLYYSCYFGRKDILGLTVAIEPAVGKILWSTTKYAVHGGCTISGKDGRLYLGGYNAPDGKKNHIWCLDAKDGSLIWESDPLGWATHVVTIADDFVFSHAQYRTGTLLTLSGGKTICNLTRGYNCTRFTMAGRYLLGSNMDIYDTSQDNRLVSSGPAVDVITCTGAHISNGRIFFTANGGGLQLSMSYGQEAEQMTGPFSPLKCYENTSTTRKRVD